MSLCLSVLLTGYKGLGFAAIWSMFLVCFMAYIGTKTIYSKTGTPPLLIGFLIGEWLSYLVSLSISQQSKHAINYVAVNSVASLLACLFIFSLIVHLLYNRRPFTFVLYVRILAYVIPALLLPRLRIFHFCHWVEINALRYGDNFNSQLFWTVLNNLLVLSIDLSELFLSFFLSFFLQALMPWTMRWVLSPSSISFFMDSGPSCWVRSGVAWLTIPSRQHLRAPRSVLSCYASFLSSFFL